MRALARSARKRKFDPPPPRALGRSFNLTQEWKVTTDNMEVSKPAAALKVKAKGLEVSLT